MHKVVLGLAGRKSSGKSAVCNRLVAEYGAVKSSFADPLKKMLRTIGLTDDQLWGALKETPDHDTLLGQTPRHAMQTLGTEWGRKLISPDLWARLWLKLEAVERPTFMVIEDVRFDNEVAAIRQLGGIVIGIERGAPTRVQTWKERLRLVHASENFRQLVRRNNLLVVENDGTIDELMTRVMLEVHLEFDTKREKALTTPL